jgi:hypothetical protein
MIRRKPGLSHEQFRKHMEESHARLAQKYVGHLFVEYRRNYAKEASFGGDLREPGSGFGPKPWQFDCISEWIMASEKDYLEVRRIMGQPEIDRQFHEDEDRFLDRTSVVMVVCDVADTGTGDGHGTLKAAKA